MGRMKSAIRKKIDEEFQKGIQLREMSCNENIPFDKSQEMRKEQDKHYKKYKFFRELNNAMEKNKNVNDKKDKEDKE